MHKRFNGPVDPARRDAVQRALGSAGLSSLGLMGIGGCAVWRRPDDAPDPGSDRAPHHPTPEPPRLATLTTFSSATTDGPWPTGWHPYVLRRDLPRTRYDLVRHNGTQVLRARARRSATGLHCGLQATAAGWLRFSWQVAQVAPLASVAAAELDDSPARIVVAFDGDHQRLPLRDRLLFDQVELFTGQRLPYAMLMYVWGGANNPLESVHRNHRTARIQYLTLEHGAQRVGQWLHYQRNLAADFVRAFGEAPGPVISVGVLTDADALKLELGALYGDISLLPPLA